ncbi:MAG: GNAT family N-acetyltransferase [Acidimicrobiales bacterium]
MRCRLVLGRDRAAVADALSDAFAQDPLMSWLIGLDDPAARAVALRTAMFVPAVRAAGRGGNSFLLQDDAGTVAGAALWVAPDSGFFTRADVELVRSELAQWADPGAEQRLGALGEVLGRHHLTPPADQPHFHLQFLGMAGAHRGRGSGASLLGPVLARCDADGLAATLESSNPRNLSFYRRLGFETVWEDAPEGGPILTGMARGPR